jgi:lipopolysaccharide/colanic/teichoic acid biosynthesis glycosyltransferase
MAMQPNPQGPLEAVSTTQPAVRRLRLAPDALPGLTTQQLVAKRSLDLCASAVGLVVLSPVIAATWLIARKDTGGSGFFRQERVGRYGRTFKVVKLRTMRAGTVGTTVTRSGDARITKWGGRFRRYKLDELPQLWNVLLGQMSLVGPRPDVPGYADTLQGEARAILSLRPGITGPATLAWRNEEELLGSVEDPETYNREVIYPDKIARNLEYLRSYSIVGDFRYVLATIFSKTGASFVAH